MNININPIRNVNEINVKFINNYIQTLKPGDYTLNLEQQTGGIGEGGTVEDKFSTQKRFIIKSNRFNLAADTIYSLFPLNGISGDYSNCIAHIVLNNKALPWIRFLEDGKNSPWLALLTFLEDEAPLIKNITLGDYKTDQLPAPEEKVLFYEFTKEIDEEDNDKCQIIDLEVSLFNKLIPNIDDINYLSHVREVDITKKSSNFLKTSSFPELKENSIPSTQLFAVVASNRLLTTPGKYITHLISLENMGKYLPNENDQNSIDSVYSYLRLVTLYNWNFTVTEHTENLSDVISVLNNSYQDKINLALPNITSEKPSSITDQINQAYNMGYNVAEYYMRGSDINICWYKGPFVPYLVTPNIITWPNNSPDALLKLNPDTAMFDVSYAAAWQLGNLLAIQNKHFSDELYKWKKNNQSLAIKTLENQVISEQLIDLPIDYANINRSTLTKEMMEKIKTTLSKYLNNR